MRTLFTECFIITWANRHRASPLRKPFSFSVYPSIHPSIYLLVSEISSTMWKVTTVMTVGWKNFWEGEFGNGHYHFMLTFIKQRGSEDRQKTFWLDSQTSEGTQSSRHQTRQSRLPHSIKLSPPAVLSVTYIKIWQRKTESQMLLKLNESYNINFYIAGKNLKWFTWGSLFIVQALKNCFIRCCCCPFFTFYLACQVGAHFPIYKWF